MKCKNCGKKMTLGVPSSNDIKFQLNCLCGQTETIKYSLAELAANNDKEKK